jgi:hypothetical protein
MTFTAQQSISAAQTRFVWRARFKVAPLLIGVVEDAFEAGRGRLDARMWGVVPMARARGRHIDRGEAQRYVAEIVWCPMALVHNPELRFRTISERVVRTWMHDEDTYIDLIFDDSGDISDVRTTTRARDGNLVQPWQGCFSEPRDFGEMRAPSRAEVSWETPEGPFVYWQGCVTSLTFAD